jgi:hypothetical protein
MLFLGYIYWKKNTNYGLDFYDNIYIFGLFAFISTCLLIKNYEPYFIAALVVNILAVLFFLAADRFNVMINYEKWIDRGMPNTFEESRMKHIDINPELEKLDKELSLWRRKALDGEISQEKYNNESERIRVERKKWINEIP